MMTMKKIAGLTLSLLMMTGAVAHAQDYNRGDDRHDQRQDQRHDDRQAYNRGDDHHDWGDRDGFQREWGQRGADYDHEWRRGERLPDGYWADRRYAVDDYRAHHLGPPRRGYHWVRYVNGFVMVRNSDGLVNRFIRDLVR